MRTLTVMWVLSRNHFRRGATLGDAILTFLLVGITMTPLEPSYSFRYLGMVYGLAACMIPGLSAIVISGTASSQRGEPFMLRTGRVSYYLGSMAAAWVMGLLWVGAMGLLLPWLKVTEAPEGWLALLAGTVAINSLLSVALFTLLSPLTGGAKEAVLGAALLIMGLNTAWFAEQQAAWVQRLEYLVPPFLLHAQPAAADLLRIGLYGAAILGLGLLRFGRREFFRN